MKHIDVSTFCGPASEGPDRLRIQITETSERGNYRIVVLTRSEALKVAQLLVQKAKPVKQRA